MNKSLKVQLGLTTLVVLLVAAQWRRSFRQSEELEAVRSQILVQKEQFETRRLQLEALEKRSQELQEMESQAGNQTLLALMRERAAISKPNSLPAAQAQGMGHAIANVLDNSEHWKTEQEHLRNEMRAGLGTFFKLAKVPSDRAEQFIDLGIEAQRRKAARLSGLLHGTMNVADALRERDNDEAEMVQRRHEALGDEADAFYNGIADGMRNDEAKRQLKLIQQNMGGNDLNPDQAERLQALLKTEIVAINMDEVDLFRPPDEWTQRFLQQQQNVLQAVADFLTPAQIETLKVIAAYDLADRQKQMAAQRSSLGIK